MDKDGMVAVVRGTTNSGLCVTLLDGTRQYTLLPNTVTHPYQQTTSQASQAVGPTQYAVENSAQAVDGRYASVYQTVHCNMVPTSPTVDVSEFPPQRAELSKGHGNFEVGGLGSGETSYYPSRAKDSFRGGLTWPERGAVFSPRPSVEPDHFASSLRKYPSMSAERSSEMVERLINYTQFKNSKAQRLQTLRSEMSNRPRKTIEADIRTDESPTRERSRRYEDAPMTDRYERSRRDDDRCKKNEEGDRRFDRSYEVRNFRDMSRRARETAVRNVQISIDTQVEIPRMSSKEVATVPKINPSVRNVAIPMSPLPSIYILPTTAADTKTSKSIQTLKSQNIQLLRRKSAQTCFSSMDITNKKIKNGRKSKSQEELRDNEGDDEVIQLVQYLTDSEEKGTLRDDLVKKLKKIYKADKSDRLKIKFGRCVRDQLFSEMDLKDFTRELSNQLLFKMKKNSLLRGNLTNLYRAELQSHRNYHEENCVDDVINEWLRDIPIKNRDYLGKSIKKDHLLLTVANKIKDIVMSKLKLDSDKSLKTEIIHLIEDIPIAICGFEKRLYLNRLATDLIRRIKEIITMCNHKIGKSNADNKNNINIAIASKGHTNKEEEIKCYVREELANFVRKFQLRICDESMDELEVELTEIVLDAIVTIQTGKEDKVKEDILSTLFYLLNITDYQGNYFANNMILNMKKMFDGGPKIRSQTFIVVDTQKRVNNTQGIMDENDIKANLVWYTNQILQKINEWISSIDGLDPNNNFTKVVIHELAGDIVDRHKYLELNPTTKVSKTDEIEHLKYQIFKSINKLVGDDNLETIEKAPELMERIKNIPVPMLIKPQNTVQGCCQMYCDCYNRPRSNSKRTNVTVDYGKGIGRSNITVAIGSVTRNKAPPSDSEESRIGSQAYNKANSLPAQSVKPNATERMSDPTDNRQPKRSSPKDGQSCCDNEECDMPAEQKTQEQILEEFDQFLKEWVQRIPMSEKPELIEKCRLGIYNGIWKAITKIKMNPEGLDNPLLYKDVLDDEIEELLDCLTQTPELKKERNGLKAEVIEKAADINMNEAPAALNTSYRQQLVENISNNLPRTANRVEHIEEDANKLFEEAMKLHLAEYFILYTKYKDGDTIKANVFKRRLLKEVHILVNGIKQAHGKELREIEIKQHVEGIIHALQKVPVPNDETVNLETDEIILALEVEQWFSDLPLMPNEERMDVLSRTKYRDMLAKKLFDLENSNEDENEEQMKEEITKFLKRMPFIRGEAENIPFMVDELMTRIKNRPRYDTDDDNRNGVAFVEPHGYEAFTRDMPLCSSYTEDQNGSSYFIVGGERVTDRSMVYGGQHVQGRNDPDSQQEWPSLGQSSANRPTCSHSTSFPPQRNPESQQEWLTLEQTTTPEAMKGSLQGASICCGRPTCSHSSSPPPQPDPNSQQEWLTLEQTSIPEAMQGSPQGDSLCCGRPTCLHSSSPPPQPDPDSQQELLTLEQTHIPGAMKGSPQSATPCCEQRTCSHSTSLPPQRHPNSQQERIPLRRSSSPGAMKGSPQAAGSQGSGRPWSQSTSPPPQKWLPSQQEQSFEQSKTQSPIRRTDSCCKRASCLSQTSTQTVPILDLAESGTVPSRDWEQPPPKNISKKKTKTAKVPKGNPPCAKVSKGRIVICECPPTDTVSRGQSPDTSRVSKVCKGRIVICQCPPADTVSRGQSPATSGVSRSQSSGDNSEPVSSNCKVFKTTNNSTRKSLPAGKVSRGQSPATSKGSRGQSPATSKGSRGQSPATGKVSSQSSDEKSEPVTSKTRVKKCKRTPKVKCECFETPNIVTSNIPPAGGISRSQLSNEKAEPVKSNSKVNKTPNNVSRKSPSADKVSRGQSPGTGKVSSQSSEEKSKTVTSKTCIKICKKDPKAECACFETPNNVTSKTLPAGGVSRSQSSIENAAPVTSTSKVNKTPNNLSRKSPSAGKVSRGQSPSTCKVSRVQSPATGKVSSQSSDEESRPVKSKTRVKKSKKEPKVKCECFETSKVKYKCCKKPKVKCECFEIPNIPPVDIVSSQSSDEILEPVTSKTCGKKEPKVKCECFERSKYKCCKTPKVKCECFERSKYKCCIKPKVKCECFETPILPVDTVSNQLVSQPDEKLEPVTAETCGKECKKEPKVKCECFEISKVKCECLETSKFGCECFETNDPPETVSRGQSPDSTRQSLEDESRPLTSITQTTESLNGECGCGTTPTFRTVQTQSNLPESTTRSGPGHSYDSPEEYSGRPDEHSAQQGIAGPNTSRAKKRNRDIEQERREAARRRVDMDQTEESDEDDLTCKCQERIWRWKQNRQCKPCDDPTDFMYPFPMMYPPPPCFNRYMNIN